MFKVCGVVVDLVEVFAYHVLVQEVETGDIYLVPLSAFDQTGDDATVDSNVISMRGWKSCRENEDEIGFKKPKSHKTRQKPKKARVLALAR